MILSDTRIREEAAEDERRESERGLFHDLLEESMGLNLREEFSSAVTRGGDVINPDKIIIANGIVTWKKRSKILIGGDSISIPIDKVSTVELNVAIVGTDIIIRSNGSGTIRAENFTKSDAQKIKSLLGH